MVERTEDLEAPATKGDFDRLINKLQTWIDRPIKGGSRDE